MPREWKQYPTPKDVETPYGLADIAVTDAEHIHICNSKSGEGLTLKNRAYTISAHINFLDGEWTPTHTYSPNNAPPATLKSFGEHLARFVAEWTDQHPEVLREAGATELHNKLYYAEKKVAEARATLAEAEAELKLLEESA